MKKIFLATTALALVFASCNHEADFDGMTEYRPGNVVKLQLTYGGDYTAAGGFISGVDDNPENATAPAKLNIEKWLNGAYYTAQKGSEATVKYNAIKTLESEVIGLDETFQRNNMTNATTELPGWLNFSASGNRYWVNKTYSSNSYTQISGVCDTWFIAPKYTVTKGDVFSFETSIGFKKGECFKVLISENFDGSSNNVTYKNTVWTDVSATFNLEGPSDAYGVMVPAGELSLDKYAGKSIYIAFRYTGVGAETATVQVDNVLIERTQSEKITVVKEARAAVDNDNSKWTVTLPSDIPDVLVDQNFEDGTDKKNIELEGWGNVKMKGTYAWQYASFSNNRYASLSAHKHDAGDLETWLITPALALGKDMILGFDFEYRYNVGDVFTLMISTDYTGDQTVPSAWKDITPTTLDKDNDKSFTSYTVDLAEYTGKTIYIGFRYIGNKESLTTTCQIDNIYVGIPK